MADKIQIAYDLTKQRANDRGVAVNIGPDMFNLIWPRAELKFFNNAFRSYADTQMVSDAISKWMSDPLFLNVNAQGRWDFFTNMNLLHVDSLAGYLPSTTTGQIGAFGAITGGSGYVDATYDNVTLTGGTGTLAKANITVSGGAVTAINHLNNPGINYAAGNTLSASNTNLGGTGSGFSVTVSAVNSVTPYSISRVEKAKVPDNLSSQYDAPDREFPIYTQYSTWFQFHPIDVGFVQLVYLKNPTPSFWGYTLNGNINTLTGLVGGSSYTNGTYTNVPLTDGAGNGALATVVVSGNAVTSVTITNRGKLYKTGDTLSALAANIGGTGTGFSITVSSIANARPVYDANTSVQPLWNDNDLSLIVDYALADIAINSRDTELQRFAQVQTQGNILQ